MVRINAQKSFIIEIHTVFILLNEFELSIEKLKSKNCIAISTQARNKTNFFLKNATRWYQNK